ncbi:MAG: hypothetical protein GY722_28505, partial [bacterium]|nr:hypothetical protein [bacterium]
VGLLHYWPLDAGSGNGAADLTGHGGDGYVYVPGWTGDGAPVTSTVQTDLDGNYSMGGIRYGESTTFAVIPSAPNRTFDPTYTNITLDENSPIQNEIEFRDITAFSLTGLIDFDNTSCLNEGVEIYLDGALAGVTLADGSYSIAAMAGDHVLTVEKGSNTFSPASYDLLVTDDIAGLNFSNTTTSIMSGFVGGSCDLSAGTLRFRIATEDGCFEEYFDSDGVYSVQLPAQEYIVSYEGLIVDIGIDAGALLTYFQAQGSFRVDLSDGDETLDLLYRAPLSMSIEGFPEIPCEFITDLETGAVSVGAPIIAQLGEVPLTINVYESYGTFDCPVDSGTVTIFDEIMDVTDTPTVLDIVDGQVTYTTIGNLPNIYAGRLDEFGNDRSYQKPISFVAEVPGQTIYSTTKWAMVTGDKPRIGTFVSAVSEELPMLILRDPPGDGSTAFLEEGKTFTYGFEGSVLEAVSGGVELEVEAGFEFAAGSMFFTTASDAGVETSLGFEIGVSATVTGGVEFSVTTTETFSTSDEQVFVGDGADLMLGVAMNLLFAKTDVVGFDPDGCLVTHSQKIRFGADGDKPFETIYLYTTGHIEGNLIPQLIELAELAPEDSVYFAGQAGNWQNLLTLNDDLRTEALENVVENRSFSAGAEFGYTHESTESETF